MNPILPLTSRIASAPWKDLLLVACLSSLIFAFAHRQALSNPYVVNDDVRQQIYWMQKWQDPALFPGDRFSEYAAHYVPWGVQSVYRMASFFMNPVQFSKVLTGILFVFLSCLFFLLGRTLGGTRAGWITACVSWLMPFFLFNLSGGLAHSFAAPLLCMFLLCRLRRSGPAMGITLLLQSLFIPYVFVHCVTAVFLSWIWRFFRPAAGEPFRFPSGAAHFLLILLSSSIVLLFTWSYNESGFGPLVTIPDMEGRPEFGPNGRYPLYPAPSLFSELSIGGVVPFSKWGLAEGVATLVPLIGLAVLGFRARDRRSMGVHLDPCVFIALASLLLYGLARIFLARLFIPSRYVEYPVNVFYCLAIGLAVSGVIEKWLWKWFSSPLVRSSLLLPAFVLVGFRLQGIGLYDYSEYRPLSEALMKTDPGSLIAGHPYLVDNVPTFAKRNGFVFFEISHPWSRGLWQDIEPKIRELMQAYYAGSAEELLGFCRKYGIDYLVVDERHFTPEFLADKPLFAPFDEEIRQTVAGRNHFAAIHDFDSCDVGVMGPIRIIRVRDCTGH